MNMDINISEVQIIPVKPQDGLVAFTSFILNGQLYIGNIALYTSPSSADGHRLVYPAKTLPNGKIIQCVHPINRETGESIKKAIMAKYVELIKKTESD